MYARRPAVSVTRSSCAALIAVSLTALSLGALVSLSNGSQDVAYLIGGLGASLVVAALFLVPVGAFPGIVLLATLLIPTEVTLFPRVLQGAAIGVVPLVVWMFRTRRSVTVPGSLKVLASAFALWLVVSEVFAPVHTHHGWEWLATATIAVVFVAVTPPPLESYKFRRSFLNLATWLGLYAVLEGFLLHSNPLFGQLLGHTAWWTAQQHGVSYRATTLLGHPLVNGTVFSAAAVLAAADLMERQGSPRLAWTRLAVLAAAVLATHSRGAAIALAVGVTVVIIFGHGRTRSLASRRLVLLVSAVFGAALVISGLQARNESSQGRASAAVRVAVVSRASQTLRGLEPFGAGPGESDTYRTRHQLPGSEVALENSYAELAVSLGPAGALIVLVLLLLPVIVGLRNGLVVGEAAALLTILVGITGYNAIEGHPSMLVLIGLFIASILTARGKVVMRRTTRPVDHPKSRQCHGSLKRNGHDRYAYSKLAG
jgi:O-Antigen ligase